jgi:hypothetical protein
MEEAAARIEAAEQAAQRGEDLHNEDLECKEVAAFTSIDDTQITKPLHFYETLPEFIFPFLLISLTIGAIFMALFSSYSPINLKRLRIYLKH